MKPRIGEGVKAPAEVVVPISENAVTCAVFNAVVEVELGRPCQSASEVEEIHSTMNRYSGEIEAALEDFGLVDPSDSNELSRLQRELKIALADS